MFVVQFHIGILSKYAVNKVAFVESLSVTTTYQKEQNS